MSIVLVTGPLLENKESQNVFYFEKVQKPTNQNRLYWNSDQACLPEIITLHWFFKGKCRHPPKVIRCERITCLLSRVCESKMKLSRPPLQQREREKERELPLPRRSCSAPRRFSSAPEEKVRFLNVTGVIVPDGIIGEKRLRSSTILCPPPTPLHPLGASDVGGEGYKHYLPSMRITTSV